MEDLEADSEVSEMHGTLETLTRLGLADDFIQAVAHTKSEEAEDLAASLQEELVSISEAETALTAEKRRAIASEARADRVRYRPAGTTKTYQSGARFHQVPF